MVFEAVKKFGVAVSIFGGPNNSFSGKSKEGSRVTRYYGVAELRKFGEEFATVITLSATRLGETHQIQRMDRVRREIRRGVTVAE